MEAYRDKYLKEQSPKARNKALQMHLSVPFVRQFSPTNGRFSDTRA